MFYDLLVTCTSCGKVSNLERLVKEKLVYYFYYTPYSKVCKFTCPHCGEAVRYEIDVEKPYDRILEKISEDIYLVELNKRIRIMYRHILLEEKFRYIDHVGDKHLVLQTEDRDILVFDVEQRKYVFTYDFDIGGSVVNMLDGKLDRAFCRHGDDYYLIDSSFTVLRRFGYREDESGRVIETVIPTLLVNNISLETDNTIIPIYVLCGSQFLVYDQDGRLLKTYELDSRYIGRIHAEYPYDNRYIQLKYKGSETFFDLYRGEFVEGTGQLKQLQQHENFILGRTDSELHIYNRNYIPSRHYVVQLPNGHLGLNAIMTNQILMIFIFLPYEKMITHMIHRDRDLMISVSVDESVSVEALIEIYNKEVVNNCNIDI